jgi:glutamine amidotransferase
MREARGTAWTDWLTGRGIPALSGVDTRSLVLRIREGGAMRGIVVSGEGSVEEALRAVREQPPMAGRALAAAVSTDEPYVFSEDGRARVAVVDYGCKRSILGRLAEASAAVTVYPHDVDSDELVAYDGVVLSNGPGDPEPLRAEVETVRALLGRVPILGICLGCQLMARESEEFGRHEGRGWLEARVVALVPDDASLRVPHVGWNDVRQVARSPLFRNVPNGALFYHVHGYRMEVADPSLVAGETDYGGTFPSVVQRDNVFAVLFHPEKSQALGLRLLKNFGDLAARC